MRWQPAAAGQFSQLGQPVPRAMTASHLAATCALPDLCRAGQAHWHTPHALLLPKKAAGPRLPQPPQLGLVQGTSAQERAAVRAEHAAAASLAPQQEGQAALLLRQELPPPPPPPPPEQQVEAEPPLPLPLPPPHQQRQQGAVERRCSHCGDAKVSKWRRQPVTQEMTVC